MAKFFKSRHFCRDCMHTNMQQSNTHCYYCILASIDDRLWGLDQESHLVCKKSTTLNLKPDTGTGLPPHDEIDEEEWEII